MDQTGALNSAILSLRKPSATPDDRKFKVELVAYHLPQIRNLQNVWLLLNELALSPDLLSTNTHENLATVLLLTDAVTYAAQRKARVSDPSHSYAEWEKQLVNCAYRVPPLFGLIILAGVCRHHSQLANQLPGFVQQVVNKCQNGELALLAAGCLSRAQWSREVLLTVFPRLPLPTVQILIDAISALVFDPLQINNDAGLVYNEYAGWSRTLGRLLEVSGEECLGKFLTKLLAYVHFITQSVPYTPDPSASQALLKKVAFGVVVQMEGVVSQVVSSLRLHLSTRVTLIGKILGCLQVLGLVYESVGTQFASYQFVLAACLDTLQASRPADRLAIVVDLGKQWSCQSVVASEFEAGQLLFFLNISEQLVLLLSTSDAQRTVVPIAQSYLTLDKLNSLKLSTAVFEAAHAVMLSFLASHSDQRSDQVDKAALAYFDQLITLFPLSLNGRQLMSAISAVLRAVNPPNQRLVLNQLFTLAKRTIPGNETSAEIASDAPPTPRAAIIAALLQGVVLYSPPTELPAWLSQIGSMVPLATSPSTQRERTYLREKFSEVIMLMGELSDIGVRWYFNELSRL